MKIIGIAGSPVANGNNERIIDHVLASARGKGFEVEKLFMSRLSIAYCTACNLCKKEMGRCSIRDDMDEVMPKLVSSDAIIVSSPVYFGSVSAQLKAMFDRTLPLRRDGFKLKDKIGAAIGIGASRNGGQEFTIQAIHSWMNIHGMIIVGDNSHFGGTVEAPFEKDEFGKQTVNAMLDKVCDLLFRIMPKPRY